MLASCFQLHRRFFLGFDFAFFDLAGFPVLFDVAGIFERPCSATTAEHLRRRAPPCPLTFTINFGLLVDFSLPRITGCAGPPPTISMHILSLDLITPTMFGLNLMETQTLFVAGTNAEPAVFPMKRLLRAVGPGAVCVGTFFGTVFGAGNRRRRST